MIVICKNCETKYDIKDEVIPPQGAQLKCAKCEEMIFVTKDVSVSDEETVDISSENPPEGENVFSDFDERPTILAPKSFHEELSNQHKEEDDDDSSSKSGISPNFLSENHDSGPSFDEVFDDFENEVSNESGKKTSLEDNDIELDDKPKAKVKKDSIDNALDGFFDDLTSTSDKKEEINDDILSDDIGVSVGSDIEEVEVEVSYEKSNVSEKFTSNDEETQEISTVEMDSLKEKLKDELNDSDFIQSSEQNASVAQAKSDSQIYVKLEDGPVFEFQVEKDMIEWLKAKNSLSGILYSLDNLDFSPILNHQLFKDVEEIIKKGQDEDINVVSASSILEKGDSAPKTKSNLLPIVLFFAALIVFLVVYLLHLSNVLNLSFLDSITPKPKVIIEKHTEIQGATTRVKIKKVDTSNKGKDASTATSPVKQGNGKDASTATSPVKQGNGKDVSTATSPVKQGNGKDVSTKSPVKQERHSNAVSVQQQENGITKSPVKQENGITKSPVKKERHSDAVSVQKEESNEPYIIKANEKRSYYKKARLASKAKNVAETKKRYLTIAYNYPKEAEAYGVLYGVLKKDKRDRKYASLFIKAYKALTNKKENTTVTKALVKELLK